jgi:hypothetical protein
MTIGLVTGANDWEDVMGRVRRIASRLGGCIGVGLMLCLALGATPSLAAQDVSDLEGTLYAYFREGDAESVLLLGELTSDVPGLAAEMVSPDNVAAIFEGYTTFTNYDFAADLSPTYIDQIDEADEYMVFAGDFTGQTGTVPAYVVILSASDKVFLLQGFVANADDLFELAALTIAGGTAPETFKDYTRILSPAAESATPQASPVASPVSQQGSDTGVFCHVDPNLAVADLNGDGLITIDELSTFSDVEGVDNLIASMVQNGFDAVQYQGC